MADACASSDDSEPLAVLVMPLALMLVLVPVLLLGVAIAIAVEAVRSSAAAAVPGGVMLESPKHGCAGVDDSGGVCAADADADADASPIACTAT